MYYQPYRRRDSSLRFAPSALLPATFPLGKDLSAVIFNLHHQWEDHQQITHCNVSVSLHQKSSVCGSHRSPTQHFRGLQTNRTKSQTLPTNPRQIKRQQTAHSLHPNTLLLVVPSFPCINLFHLCSKPSLMPPLSRVTGAWPGPGSEQGGSHTSG